MSDQFKYFSTKGLDVYTKLLEEQKRKLNKASYDMGVAQAIDGWHENSQYDEALQRAELEGSRLKEMQEIIESAVIYEPTEQNEVIKIGSTVFYINGGADEVKEITIGAFGESDLKLKIFTYESPVGQALLRRRVGEASQIKLTGCTNTLYVKEIHPPSHAYWKILKALWD